MIAEYLRTCEDGIRVDIEMRRFRCLRSLLARVGTACMAEYCAIVRYSEEKKYVSVVRSGYSPLSGQGMASTDEFEGRLSECLVRRLASEKKPSDEGFIVAMSLPNDPGRSFIVVRRVYPPLEVLVNDDVTYWLVIVDPSVTTGLKHTYCMEPMILRFSSVVAYWFSWKKELKESHRLDIGREWKRYLSADAEQSSAAEHEQRQSVMDSIRARFDGSLLFPKSPRDFANTVELLIPKKATNETWLESGSHYSTFYKDLASGCSGCDVDNPRHICLLKQQIHAAISCPQLAVDQYEIGAIAELSVWKSGFWKDAFEGSGVAPEWDKFVDERLDGLRSVSDCLDAKSVECINSAQFEDRSLLIFFVARAIRISIPKFRRAWSETEDRKFETVHEEHLVWLSQMANLGTLLLARVDWTAESIENLIHVFAGFGHFVLDVPEWMDLARHLRQTLRAEPALHTLKRRYRDHFFHTLEVCLIGFVLLHSKPHRRQNSSLADFVLSRCYDRMPNKSLPPGFLPESPEGFMRQWWIASLGHDTAYGIDVLKSTVELLAYFSNDPAVGEFQAGVRSAVKKLGEHHRLMIPELASDASLEKGDHGAITAGHILETARRYGPETVQSMMPAIRAIAFHNTKNAVVDAGRDPVAALLILCDTIQDWGRSQLGHDRSSAQVLARLVATAPKPPDEQFGPIHRFAFSLTVGEPFSHRWKKQSGAKSALEIDLFYAREPGMIDRTIFNFADFTYNLQRVDFRSWDVDFRIKYFIPLDSLDSDSPIRKLTRLARTHEAGFLAPWLSAARSADPEQAVAAQIESQGNQIWETVTFQVGLLYGHMEAERPLMGGSLSDFGRFMNLTGKSPEQRSPV